MGGGTRRACRGPWGPSGVARVLAGKRGAAEAPPPVDLGNCWGCPGLGPSWVAQNERPGCGAGAAEVMGEAGPSLDPPPRHHPQPRGGVATRQHFRGLPVHQPSPSASCAWQLVVERGTWPLCPQQPCLPSWAPAECGLTTKPGHMDAAGRRGGSQGGGSCGPESRPHAVRPAVPPTTSPEGWGSGPGGDKSVYITDVEWAPCCLNPRAKDRLGGGARELP